MMSAVVRRLNEERLKASKVTPFSVGDNVKVHVKIKEGDKERIQAFAGAVIARTGEGVNESFTVRRISHGVGVERTFPVHTPHLAKIEVESSARVRRAKLYYLRGAGRAGRLRAQTRKGQAEAAPAAPAGA